MNKQNEQANKTKKLFVIALALTVLVLSGVLAGCGAGKTADAETSVAEMEMVPSTQEASQATEPTVTESTETEPVTPMPWDEAGAKQPADYTWEEYEALTGAQQQAFRACLGAEYAQWLDGMRAYANVKPWDEPGAKQPDAYTWEEYEALTPGQQIAFQHYLGRDAFSVWLDRVQGQIGDMPWDEAGAKQPVDYTWEEFDSLTGSQQMIFQYHLGEAGFKSWLEDAEHQDEVFPWEADGAKQPVEYTWEEFEALTPAQQMAFQAVLGIDVFDSWLNKAQFQSVTYPWEKTNAKQPEEYTWSEFEALTPEQQMAFQVYLGAEGFDNWLNCAQSQTEVAPWERPGAKQPNDYTWSEFEALPPAQKMAFQEHLGAEGFDNWMNRAQSQTEVYPWEKPGAKQPEDYTWTEFEALTPAQQMAFQDALGQEAFELWMAQATGQ